MKKEALAEILSKDYQQNKDVFAQLFAEEKTKAKKTSKKS